MEYNFPIGLIIFCIAIAVVEIAAMWKVFEKAGQPGWACIIPIYNIYIDQDRWKTGLVGVADVYSFCQSHICDMAL